MIRKFFFENAVVGAQLELRHGVVVVTSDGHIAEVDEATSPPEGASSHFFGMPGLIDCHVHLALSGGSDIEAEARSLTEASARAAIVRNSRLHLAAGVTTVRDLGSPFNSVLASAQLLANSPEAPHVVAAGAISSSAGHGNFLASHADSDDEFFAQVDAAALAGASVIKLFSTGGVITAGTDPGAVQMSPLLLARVTEFAHQRGLRVAAHAHSSDGIRNALDAQVDTIEHCSYMDPALVSLLATSSSFAVSTVVATERFVGCPDPIGSSPEAVAKIRAHAPHERRSTCLLGEPDVAERVAAGTDAGTTFNPHGTGLGEQAVFLRESGMSAEQVLRVLTVNGAAAIGVDAGVIRVGAPADLLILRANPLIDVRALSQVEQVVLGGAKDTVFIPGR